MVFNMWLTENFYNKETTVIEKHEEINIIQQMETINTCNLGIIWHIFLSST